MRGCEGGRVGGCKDVYARGGRTGFIRLLIDLLVNCIFCT